MALYQPDYSIDLWSHVAEKRRRVYVSIIHFLYHGPVNAPILIHSHSTHRNQQTSPFLNLPAEVRNTIYILVLGNRTYRFHDAIARPHARLNSDNEHHILALLLVSHQIYAETALLPYSLNTFSFRECDISLTPFLAHRHLTHFRAIRSIELHTYRAEMMWAAVPNENSGFEQLLHTRLLERLPNLAEIRVVVDMMSSLYINSWDTHLRHGTQEINDNQRRLEDMITRAREDVVVRFFWV
jgi:hypothetical protein